MVKIAFYMFFAIYNPLPLTMLNCNFYIYYYLRVYSLFMGTWEHGNRDARPPWRTDALTVLYAYPGFQFGMHYFLIISPLPFLSHQLGLPSTVKASVRQGVLIPMEDDKRL